MAKRDRDHDRIKVTISWNQPDNTVLSKLANEAILKRISEALPSKTAAGLQSDIRKEVKLATTPTGLRKHTHVYRFKYKRPWRNTRQTDLWSIFSFGIQLKKLEQELAGELGFTTDVDMQVDRLPWVFDNGDLCGNSSLKLALRPGCCTYLVEGVEPTKVGRSSDSFNKLMGFKDDPDRLATDFMIIGEPRTAWKLYKYYLQLKRGGKLIQQDLDHHRLSTAFPDLVRVLYRHSTLNPEWTLVEPDGPKMYGQYMDHIMTGVPLQATFYECPDFGLRYEIKTVNPK